MSIENSCNKIQESLARIRRYNTVVKNDNFSQEALGELKDNCKNICDEAKSELDTIKDEIDTWQ